MSAALVLTLMLAQAPPAAESAEAARLERIRRALTEASALAVPPVTRADGPVFRVTVRERQPDKPWDNWSPVPTYIRPWFRAYHHEFLEQVTPEQFRSATLYPTGVPLVPLIESLARRIKAANRKRQEVHAKEEVRRALEELLACRAKPDSPGC